MIPTLDVEQARTLLAITLWKAKQLAPEIFKNGLSISTADIQRFTADSEADKAYLVHHWHADSVDIDVTDKATGERMAAEVKAKGGGAYHRQHNAGPTEGN